tara:strand:+ start:559 stop:1350 length:792 start_codon:yes stop_codon:yes gene_type:complete
LSDFGADIIKASNPSQKYKQTIEAYKFWNNGQITKIGSPSIVSRPGRISNLKILPTNKMPKRRSLNTKSGVIAMLHSIAHIELNALDLAWDTIVRFTDENMPKEFFDNWIQIAKEEAIHFQTISQRLKDFNSDYGELPAHENLWDVALATKDNLLTRLAVVPMVFEARGLDVTPEIIKKLINANQLKSAECLKIILNEEITHVKYGERWFRWICLKKGKKPEQTWKILVNENFPDVINPKFNLEARKLAGMEKYIKLVKNLKN